MNKTMGFLMATGPDDALMSAVNRHLSIAGLALTHEDAKMLASRRADSLAEVERVEFGTPAVLAIAEAVADSPHLAQDNVAKTLATLQDVFYALRDEMPVQVPDSQIVAALRGCLDQWGDADDVAAMSTEEIMAFSDEYVLAQEMEDGEYRIADSEGNVYVFGPSNADSGAWDYDEFAPGWDGESWADGWDD